MNIGDSLKIDDDGPVVTVPSSAGRRRPQPSRQRGGQTVTGDFGYDIGSDEHDARSTPAVAPTSSTADALQPDVQLHLTGR